jgi:hypothetical protein
VRDTKARLPSQFNAELVAEILLSRGFGNFQGLRILRREDMQDSSRKCLRKPSSTIFNTGVFWSSPRPALGYNPHIDRPFLLV